MCRRMSEHCWRCSGPRNTRRPAPSQRGTHGWSSDPQRPLLGCLPRAPRSSGASSWTDWQVAPGGTADSRLRPGPCLPAARQQGAVSGRVSWWEGGGGRRGRLAFSPSRWWCSGTGSAPEPLRTVAVYHRQEVATACQSVRPANQRNSAAHGPAPFSGGGQVQNGAPGAFCLNKLYWQLNRTDLKVTDLCVNKIKHLN